MICLGNQSSEILLNKSKQMPCCQGRVETLVPFGSRATSAEYIRRGSSRRLTNMLSPFLFHKELKSYSSGGQLSLSTSSTIIWNQLMFLVEIWLADSTKQRKENFQRGFYWALIYQAKLLLRYLQLYSVLSLYNFNSTLRVPLFYFQIDKKLYVWV